MHDCLHIGGLIGKPHVLPHREINWLHPPWLVQKSCVMQQVDGGKSGDVCRHAVIRAMDEYGGEVRDVKACSRND
jgi:hypothetical protein